MLQYCYYSLLFAENILAQIFQQSFYLIKLCIECALEEYAVLMYVCPKITRYQRLTVDTFVLKLKHTLTVHFQSRDMNITEAAQKYICCEIAFYSLRFLNHHLVIMSYVSQVQCITLTTNDILILSANMLKIYREF